MVIVETPSEKEPTMKEITTTGLDAAKSVFRLRGIDADHQPVLRRQLKRRQVLLFLAADHPWRKPFIDASAGYPMRIIDRQCCALARGRSMPLPIGATR